MCHVAAYLAKHDLRDFNPKAPPPKTQAFLEIVDANRAPEDAELADIFDRLGNPHATTLIRITNEARGDFETWIKDRKNQRAIPHRLEISGYVPVLNAADKSRPVGHQRQAPAHLRQGFTSAARSLQGRQRPDGKQQLQEPEQGER